MSVTKRLWMAVLLLAAVLVLAACGADTAALQPSEPPPTAQDEANTEPTTNMESEAADTPVEEPAENNGQMEANADGTIPMPELGFDNGSPALKASNPNQFVRAAGQPQMIELFAFW